MKIGLMGMMAAALMVSVAAPAQAEVKEIWRLGGFAHPESVKYDPVHGVYYVTSINGGPLDKDGNGYISKVSTEGKMITQHWIDGALNGPKGIVIQGTKMWVTDIDQIVEIDTNKGAITHKYDAPGALFLNDPAVDEDGNVYATDTGKGTIWKLSKGKMELWYNTPDTFLVNGARVIWGNKLLVAGWGRGQNDDGTTKTLGNLFTVDLKTKAYKDLGDGRPVGNIDGLERDFHGGFLITDFVKGGMLDVRKDGSFKMLMPMKSGSADLDEMDYGHLAIVPHMLENEVAAYRIDESEYKWK